MLDCEPDKLAQSAPSQLEAQEAGQAFPRCTYVDKLSQGSMWVHPR